MKPTDNSFPAGNVTSQSVPTGTVVDVLSEVRLEISRGKEKVAVPMVLGMSLEEAAAALEEAAPVKARVKAPPAAIREQGLWQVQEATANPEALHPDKI